MRIAVLGPLEVQTDDGAPLTVPGAKERLLLAVLAAGAPDVVSTDRIVESLWDGDAPATARRSLHAHVVHLRSALEPDRPRGSSGQGLFDAEALSPDDRWIAVTDLRTSIVDLFRADDLELVRTLPAGEREGNTDIAFSPDGRLLAVTTQSGRLHVVDVETSRPNEPLTFPAALLQAEWLPDGRTVAVTSADGDVALVDATRGQLRAAPVSPSAGRPADAYVLAEEPNALVVMTGVHPARRWPLDTDTLVERACAVAGRDLTRTEWEQFLPERPLRPTCSDIG